MRVSAILSGDAVCRARESLRALACPADYISRLGGTKAKYAPWEEASEVDVLVSSCLLCADESQLEQGGPSTQCSLASTQGRPLRHRENRSRMVCSLCAYRLRIVE